MSEGEHERAAAGRLKVFVSYSRADLDFADQIVLALKDRGFEPLMDRHSIDAAEKWKDRLGALLLSCDTVVFILTEPSAQSKTCAWEVERAAELGKRMIPIVPGPLPGGAHPPPQLAELNYIHFYTDAEKPGTGFYDGVMRLERALKVDLDWLRRQTQYAERAAEWRAQDAAERRPEDHLLRATALEEAQAWLARTPVGATVAPLVRDYIVASEAAETERRIEAQANVAEREAALAEKESAVAAQARADKMARRATLVGVGVAAVLLALALWGNWSAAVQTADAADRRAALFARESEQLRFGGDIGGAILLALHGDPSADRLGWRRLFLRPDGHVATRNALLAALSAPLERQLSGDNEVILSVSFSADGKHVLSSADESVANLWSLETGEIVTRFGDPDSGVRIATSAISPNGDYVLGGLNNDRAMLWSIAGGEPLARLPHDDSVTAVVFSPDGRLALTGSEDDTARLWTVPEGRLVHTLRGHSDGISSVAFSRAGDRVLTGGRDGVAILWSVEDGRELGRAQDGDEAMTSVVFEDSSDQFVTSDGGGVRFWTYFGEGVAQRHSATSPGGYVHALAYAEGRLAVGGGDSGLIDVWVEGGRRRIATFAHDGPVYALAFSPDGARLVSGGRHMARIWRMGADAPVRDLRGGHGVFTPDGTRIVTSRSGETHVWPLQAPTLAPSREEEPLQRSEFEGDEAAVVHSQDGALRLSLDYAGQVTLRRTNDGERIAQFAPHEDYVSVAAFSADRQRILTVSNTVALVSSGDGADVIATFEHPVAIESAALSRDGRRVATGAGDGLVRLWRVDSGAVEREFRSAAEDVYVRFVAFSPDGKRLASVTGDGVHVWRVEGGPPIARFVRSTSAVSALAFSPDGRYLATLWTDALVILPSGGGPILAWFARTSALDTSYDDQGSFGVAFSPDGRSVLASTGDRTLVWRLPDVLFATAREQARIGCDRLIAVGLPTVVDPVRREATPILQGEPDSPCPAP